MPGFVGTVGRGFGSTITSGPPPDTGWGDGIAPRPDDPIAIQAVTTMEKLLKAFRFKVRQYSKIFHVLWWDPDTRPAFEGSTAVTMRSPDHNPLGQANRWGREWLLGLELRIWYRNEFDQSGSNYLWAVGAFALSWWLIDAFEGKHVHETYSPVDGTPDGAVITAGPLVLRGGRNVIKKADQHGWGYMPLIFDVPLIMPTRPAQQE